MTGERPLRTLLYFLYTFFNSLLIFPEKSYIIVLSDISQNLSKLSKGNLIMKRQRLTALFLALLLTASTAIGCAQNNPEETDASAVSATTENTPAAETEPETEPPISDDLPESDFEGYTYTIFNSNPETNDWFTTVHVTMEEDSADVLPSAIYKRNLAVEERLNITIGETEQSADQIKNAIMAGDSSFDLTLMQGSNVISYAQSGYLMDMFELPYQNYEKPYWDSNAAKQLSVCGKLFMMAGDFITTQIDETICFFFNKNLIADYNLEDPYDLVNEGRWTLDKLGKMAGQSGHDVDGNGVIDDNDNFGMLSWRGVFYMFLLNGSGHTLISKDESDIPSFTFYNENFVAAYEKILNIVHANESMYYDAEVKSNTRGLSNNHRVQEIMFPADQAMFWAECISWAKALREMEANFGIIPAPKFDEAQSQYYSCNNGNFFGMSVPVSVSDVDRTSIILEALQSASTDTVLAAYYDIALKTKMARDEESSAMIDIIFDTTTYDCSTVYGLGGVKTSIYTKASNNDADLASYWKKQQKALGKQIEKIVDKISELD